MMENTDTFMRITNKDVYNKIEELIKSNNQSHNVIIKHLITTNGKVKINRWIASTAMALIVAMITALVYKGGLK